MSWLTLLANLPTADWPEATRRLLAAPDLRASLCQPQIAETLAAHLTTLSQFTPCALAQAAHRLAHPGFDLAQPPTDQLAQAFARLTAPPLTRPTGVLAATPWNPVPDAVLAALVVRTRWQAGTDTPTTLVQTCTPASLDRWQLVFQVLWGWLDDDQRPVWLQAWLTAHPTLAVTVLAAHHFPAEVAGWLTTAPGLTPQSWPEVSAALQAHGLADLLPALAQHLAETDHTSLPVPVSVRQARYWAHSLPTANAQAGLLRAWHAARHVQAELSTHLGWLALQQGEAATALGGFQEALAVHPQHTPARIGAARALLHLHQPEQAAHVLEPIRPPTPESEVWLACAEAATAQTENARARLEALNPADLTEATAARQAAQLAERWDDSAQARRWWQRACQLHPVHAEAWARLAEHQQPEPATAQASLHVAVGLQPHHAGYRRQAGALARHHAHWPEAHLHYRALTDLPDCTPADDLALAECAWHLHDFAATLAAAHRAAPNLPTSTEQAHAFALAAQAASALHQPEQAVQLWQQVVRLNPQAGPAWLALADLHADHPAAALATLEAAHHALSQHETAPELPAVRARLGQAYAAAARWDEAQAVLQLAAPTPHTLALLGNILHRRGYLEAAARALRQALGAHPHPEPVWHELGRVLEAQGQLAEAVSALHQATRHHPASPAHFDLGRLLLAWHSRQPNPVIPPQAVAALRQAVTAMPEHAAAHALLAQALQITGDTQAALIHYQNAVRLDPATPDWPLALGQAWLSANQPDQAIACLLEAVRQHPRHVEAHVWLGQAFAARRLWHEAARVAEEALNLDAHHVEAHVLAATAAHHTGQPAQAAQHWQMALKLRPREANLLIRYAQAMLATQPATAQAALAEALAVSQHNPPAQHQIAEALRELGEHEAAFNVLSRASQNAARDPAIFSALGACAMHLHRHAEAHTAWLRAAELQPTAAEPLNQAARALWLAGRAEAALALWERARQRQPDHAPTLLQLGLALNQLERYPQALTVFRHALQTGQPTTALLNAGAHAAIHGGAWELAQHWLEQARALTPNDPDTALLLSAVARHHHQLEHALNLAQQAAALRPDDPRTLAAQAQALADLNREAEARATLNHALAALAAPEHSVEAPLVLSQAHALAVRWHDWPTAETAARQWRERAPHSAAAELALVQVWVTHSEWASQARAAELELNPPPPAWDTLHAAVQNALALGAPPDLTHAWLGRAQAAFGRWDEARATLEPLADHADPATQLALARTRRAHQQTGEAQAGVHQVLEREPESWLKAAALLELAAIHTALGDAPGALAAARRAVSAAPPLPLWQALTHYHLSVSLWATGETAASQHALLHALHLLPNPTWHARYAEHAPDPATALAHWQQAYTLQPHHRVWAWAYARALAADGDWPQAVAQYRRLTALCPTEAEAWTERGEAHLRMGDAHAAHECFAQATSLHPNHAPAWVGRARAHTLAQRPAEALEAAQQAVTLAPNDPAARQCLAETLAAQNQWAEARQHFTLAAHHAANPALAWLGVGQTYMATGQWREAAHACIRATEADPHCAEAFAALGQAWLAGRNWPNALAAFTEATRLAPRHAPYWQQLGHTCLQMGQLDQALAHLNRALELAPHADDLWRELGLVFEHRRQFDRALHAYQQAIRLAPRQAANYICAGLAHKHLKDYARAVEALERATALEPKNVEAARHLAAVSALHLIHAGS